MWRNKPVSMPFKEWAVKEIASDMDLDEKVVDAVVEHQFKSAILAMSKNKSVELSGFGKFLWNQKSSERRIITYYNSLEENKRLLAEEGIGEGRKVTITRRIAEIERNIEIIKPKVHEFLTNLRRVEEQADSREGNGEHHTIDE